MVIIVRIEDARDPRIPNDAFRFVIGILFKLLLKVTKFCYFCEKN